MRMGFIELANYKVISFDKVKDRVSQKPKVRNKLISRIMRLKNKNDKGEKR